MFFNIAGTRLFFGTPIAPATVLAALLGVGGVALIFLPELRRPAAGHDTVLGVIFSLVGTISACGGNLVSARNQRHGLPVLQLNLFGMLYGATFVALYAAAIGRHFAFDPSLRYVLSLGYLALFGSVIAFGAYLTLVGRIGADRAGYTNAAVPIVALLLSASFEGLHLGWAEVFGIALCVAGNVLVLRQRAAAARKT
jgi:drug/metabolite transporter (DMT)-like permease